jgi:hypothetical protein
VTLPADMIGAWARPKPRPRTRHRRAPVRLTRRGKTLVLGLLAAAGWAIVGAVGHVVWGLH